MRRQFVYCVVIAAWCLGVGTNAVGQFHQQHSTPRPVLRSTPQPVVRHEPPIAAPTAPAAPNQVSPPSTSNAWPDSHHHHSHHDFGGPLWYWGAGVPMIWTGAYYTPSFDVYSPVYPYPAMPNVPLAAPLRPRAAELPGPDGDPAEPNTKKLRASNAETKAKAGKFIGFGDLNFSKQKYMPALERYKTAAEMAPDVPEIYLRQGFAQVALGQYENAVKAFRRALKIRSDWTESPLRLEQIYGADQLAKANHFEVLAKAVEANPLDSNLLVALGIELFFDGKPERSAVFFARAAQLGGNDDKLVDGFLPRPGPAGEQRQPQNKKLVF